MNELSKKTYAVELTYNEIHLILNSLDEFLENNPNSISLEAIASIHSKLEPLHMNHNLSARLKLIDESQSNDVND